jgi:signal transduction histidine kinase
LLQVVASQRDRDSTATAIVEQLVVSLGALTASVYVTDDAEGRTLRLASSNDAARTTRNDALDIATSSQPAAQAARTRSLHLAGEAEPPRSDRMRDRMVLAHCGPAVSFALPLVSGDRVLGAMAAELGAPIEPRDLDELESLGVVLGAILDRARLVEELHARDEWTKVVAHEVRQPLNTMLLHASWLARETTECPISPAVKHMLGGVKRVERLLEDLVDTTLNDVAHVELYLRSTDLVALARVLAAPVEDGVPSRVQVEARGRIPRVEVDPERIEQVLANLLLNAVKYGRRGTPIRLEIEPEGEHEVALSVTNEGLDIPENEQPHLFERYYRANRGGRAQGWGIGLYVCRGIVTAHGGRITVSSGGGRTTFKVALPVAQRGSRR